MAASAVRRVRVEVQGAVQGVGLRPHVLARARALGLAGWIRNDAGRVTLEAQGAPAAVDALLEHVRAAPPPARVEAFEVVDLEPREDRAFEVRASGVHDDHPAAHGDGRDSRASDDRASDGRASDGPASASANDGPASASTSASDDRASDDRASGDRASVGANANANANDGPASASASTSTSTSTSTSASTSASTNASTSDDRASDGPASTSTSTSASTSASASTSDDRASGDRASAGANANDGPASASTSASASANANDGPASASASASASDGPASASTSTSASDDRASGDRASDGPASASTSASASDGPASASTSTSASDDRASDGPASASTSASDGPANADASTSASTSTSDDRASTSGDRASGDASDAAALVPDLRACDACLAEVERPGDRRWRYPFTSCARCGPRWSIARAMPWARERTSMAAFPPCADCARERADIDDRRCHAETIACPACGPRARSLGPAGDALAGDALEGAARALRDGLVVALQGLGGFQLLVDATSAPAVDALRARKARPTKPLAVLVADLDGARALCDLSDAEAALLASPEGPIVLARRRADAPIAGGVAPGVAELGLLLPTTPLHLLVARLAARPLVCTSGNRSEEPLCIDPAEALDRLRGIADLFLVHDRAVVRPLDDSVARAARGGTTTLLRRARGYAPRSMRIAGARRDALALGAHQKATVTRIGRDGRAVTSPHLGDLGAPAARDLHEATVRELLALGRRRVDVLACDLHPEYGSTLLAERLARELDRPLVRVQHHHAHVAAALAEHGRGDGPVLGLAWDGAGLGTDGALWGGEALRVAGASSARLAWLRPFPLPGGERAIRDPRRAALGLLFAARGRAGVESDGAALASEPERAGLLQLLARDVSCPRTTSVGRLFDAVAALLGLPGARHRAGHEGQAAMALEEAARRHGPAPAHPIEVAGSGEVDWRPLLDALLADRARGVAPERAAARFHAALVELAAALATRAGLSDVVPTGGCFQNALLAEAVEDRLSALGHRVLAPRMVPANDGGISVGQAWVASRA